MTKLNGKRVEWKETPKDIYITDVKEHIVWEDEDTGAKLTLRKIPIGGIHEYPHRHPQANHWGIMLSGEVTFPDGTQTTATENNYHFSYFRKNEKHGGGPKGTRYTKETIVLIYFDGPETKVFTDSKL